MGHNIRYANESDADSFGLVYSKSYQAAFKGIISDNILENVFSASKRTEGFLKELSEGFPFNAIMHDNDDAVGVLTYGKSKYDNLDDSFVEIWRIYLHPSYWDKNMGVELMNWALTELRQKGYKTVTLWVIEPNIRARKFYEKMGFAHDGTTRIINVGNEITDLRYIKHL